MTDTVSIGLIGKHPGYGDFLRTGISEPVAEALGLWMDATLFSLRDDMGEAWPAFWDDAQDLRFWVGRAVFGQGRTLAGVLRPSRDRIGRRYPLVLVAEGVALAPPTEVPQEQDVWTRLAAHFDAMVPGEGARALLVGLDLALMPESEAAADEGPTVWAHHPEGNLAALLRAAVSVDAHRATAARSYWWAPGGGGRAAVWLGCQGMPDAAGLGWLLAGVAAAPAAELPAEPAPGSDTVPATEAPGDV